MLGFEAIEEKSYAWLGGRYSTEDQITRREKYACDQK
jgi:hypothetical protein